MGGAKRIILGLMIVMAGFYTFTYSFFRHQFIELLKLMIGNIGLFLILSGLIIFIIGISEIN